MELFARHGFNGATIKDIADTASVAEGALYRHYAGKAEMAAALYAEESRRLVAAFSPPQPEVPGHRKIRLIVKRLYAYYEEHPYSVLFLIRNFHTLPSGPGLDWQGYLYDFVTRHVRNLGGRRQPGRRSGRNLEILPSLPSGPMLQPIIFHHYHKLPHPPLHYVDAVTAGCCLLLGADDDGCNA